MSEGDVNESGKTPSLEERLRRLEAIVAALEGGTVELDEGLRLFEEGVRHIREAEQLLSAAELRVEELVGKPESARLRSLQGPGPLKGAAKDDG